MARNPFAPWHAYWNQRSARERRMLLAAAGVVLAALVWMLVVDPMLVERKRLAAQLPQLRAEVRLMHAQANEIQRLRRDVPTTPAQGASLMGRVGSLATAQGIREHVDSLQPMGQEQVRLTAGAMPIRAWLSWVTVLEAQGIRLVHCRITPDAVSGKASIEAVLAHGSAA